MGAPGSGLGTAIDDAGADGTAARIRAAVVDGLSNPACWRCWRDGRCSSSIAAARRARGGGLLEITLRLPGPHVLLLAGPEEIAHVHGLPLAPLSASALVEAIRPRDVPAAIRRRVEAAARRSRGLPGKFVSLLWGADVRRKSQVSRLMSRAQGNIARRSSNRSDRHDGTSGRTIACVRRRQRRGSRWRAPRAAAFVGRSAASSRRCGGGWRAPLDSSTPAVTRPVTACCECDWGAGPPARLDARARRRDRPGRDPS